MTNLDLALSCAIKQCYKGSNDNFSYMYSFTTENISGYIDYFELDEKKLLTVGSSGDQALNAVLKGCRDVTVLDVNKYVQYYYYLKVAGIICLNYDEFLAFFRYSSYYDGHGYNNYAFDKAIFGKLKETLKEIDSDSFEFWNTLFEMFEGLDIRTVLFNFDEYPDYKLKKMNPYLSSEITFKGSIDKLRSVKPCFITGRIEESGISDKFDSIWLSNISQYIPLEEVIKVVNNFSKNLNDDGKMLFGYIYRYGNLKCFVNKKDFYSIQYVKELFPDGVVGLLQFEATTKGSEDAILTYKKKK